MNWEDRGQVPPQCLISIVIERKDLQCAYVFRATPNIWYLLPKFCMYHKFKDISTIDKDTGMKWVSNHLA